MAASSFAAPAFPSIKFIPASEKLTRSNFVMWHAQVLSALYVPRLPGTLARRAAPSVISDSGEGRRRQEATHAQS
jgi:hypothetical protein